MNNYGSKIFWGARPVFLKSDKEATECRHTKRDKKWNSEKDRDIDKDTYR